MPIFLLHYSNILLALKLNICYIKGMKTTSKIIEFPLTPSTKINVTATKKRMKNIKLTISKSGAVAVSLPTHVTYAYAYEFLVRKREWINATLSKILLNLSKDICIFTDNGKIFLLGNAYPLTVQQSTKNKVIFDNQFTILAKNTEPEYIKQIFIKWCKSYFMDMVSNRLKFIYNKMFTNPTVPEIKVKTMKSMWGNCNYVKRIVTLNLYLVKTPVYCIDYVITHELAHLVHHNHGKEFYALLTTLMPDWKARKKQLNNYSLQF